MGKQLIFKRPVKLYGIKRKQVVSLTNSKLNLISFVDPLTDILRSIKLSNKQMRRTKVVK